MFGHKTRGTMYPLQRVSLAHHLYVSIIDVAAAADQGERIAASLAKQRSAPVPDEDKPIYHDQPAKHWDKFYKTNSSNFFRDRKWCASFHASLIAFARGRRLGSLSARMERRHAQGKAGALPVSELVL